MMEKNLIYPMKYDLLFYSTEAKLLNNYNKLTEETLKNILNFYNYNNIPNNFEIRKRENNYFIHDIKQIENSYITQMPYIKQGNLFKTSSKIIEKPLAKNTSMYEKDMCKELWFASYYGKTNYPFDIIDIQTPLKSKRNNKYGEIDLIGVSIKDNNVFIYLIEAKPISTKETLLRGTIEGITYRYMVLSNKKHFYNDFKNYIKKYNGLGKQAIEIKKRINQNENLNYEIKTLVLVPKKLYNYRYSKIVYDNYHENIDYYYIDYDLKYIAYCEKDKRTNSLFKDAYSPIIEKFTYKK